jgi:hypothetical protein
MLDLDPAQVQPMREFIKSDQGAGPPKADAPARNAERPRRRDVGLQDPLSAARRALAASITTLLIVQQITQYIIDKYAWGRADHPWQGNRVKRMVTNR